MISLIINTNCLGESAQGLSSGKQPYANRAYLLRNFIIPQAVANPVITEVIVAGEFEEGNDYEYVPYKGIYNNCADALLQRQVGFEASNGDTSIGDIVIFQHDDHLLDFDAITLSLMLDVVSPARYTRLRNSAGERLNGGEPRPCPDPKNCREHLGIPPCGSIGYISGHCAIYRRKVIEVCPWSNVSPTFAWDGSHTKQIREAGFLIDWSTENKCWDIEYGSEPWQ